MTKAILDNRIIRYPIFYTVLRIVGGIILLYKSYLFIRNTVVAELEIQQTGIGFFTQNAETLALIITCLGLLCGFFITVGLYTRAASIIQIPILIVAVFFINIKHIGDNYFEFFLSIIMLLLLILFAIKGSGPLSAEEYFRRGAKIDQRGNQQRVPDHL
ncbi:DoxX family protein [Flavitalea sp.]|nr:DoxX family membrane protein [Flavitalea sp.]